ncbi:hypothetical protein B0H19DRAFT_716403 [Mycena capillaripes]|nr:hypothetical protein B0H19DRAFT_716403 [Mycena capillaripes]
MSFCSAVIGNTAKFAELVRSFAIGNHDYAESQMLDKSSIITDCLKTLLRIENLSINGRYLELTRQQVCASCTFPNLASCTLYSEEETYIFFNRHPGLKSVWIVSTWALFVRWVSSPSTQITLPNLERIRASPRILPSIITAGLKDVRLEWDDADVDPPEAGDPPEPLFIALRARICSSVPFTCSNACVPAECVAIIDSISRNIPRARTLQFEVYEEYEFPHDETVTQLIKTFSRFTHLQFFALYRNNLSLPLNNLNYTMNKALRVGQHLAYKAR